MNRILGAISLLVFFSTIPVRTAAHSPVPPDSDRRPGDLHGGQGFDPCLPLQLPPHPLIEAISPKYPGRRTGVDAGIKGLVPLPHLLPFLPGIAAPIADRDQLLGDQLL